MMAEHERNLPIHDNPDFSQKPTTVGFQR